MLPGPDILVQLTPPAELGLPGIWGCPGFPGICPDPGASDLCILVFIPEEFDIIPEFDAIGPLFGILPILFGMVPALFGMLPGTVGPQCERRLELAPVGSPG